MAPVPGGIPRTNLHSRVKGRDKASHPKRPVPPKLSPLRSPGLPNTSLCVFVSGGCGGTRGGFLMRVLLTGQGNE